MLNQYRNDHWVAWLLKDWNKGSISNQTQVNITPCYILFYPLPASPNYSQNSDINFVILKTYLLKFYETEFYELVDGGKFTLQYQVVTRLRLDHCPKFSHNRETNGQNCFYISWRWYKIQIIIIMSKLWTVIQ